MQCHMCLREQVQTTYKGSAYCIRCLWNTFPQLKEKKLQMDKGNYNGEAKKK